MADLDLEELSEKEIDALQAAITKRRRSKVDWDNMTHEERAMYNKTIDPQTHRGAYVEYPKTIYGKWPDGVVKRATVKNSQQEADVRKTPDVRWGNTPLEVGIETCPSPALRNTAAGFEMVGASAPDPEPEPEAVVMVQEHPAAVANRRGRPPKIRDAAA
jgi:SRSO17 transposase